jgi:alpha-beta hydrolase superfamily lysophospholipase
MARYRRIALMLLAGLGLLYGGLCGLVYWKQNQLLFFPSPELRERPPQVQEWSLKGGLQAWYFPGQGRYNLLLCHGNGGNLSHRSELALALQQIGLGVCVFDYAGYGASQGQLRKEADLVANAEAAREQLAQEGKPLLYYGESLGGGVATALAAIHPPHGLILQSTFTRLTDRASEDFPWLPVRLLSRYPLPTIERLPKLTCPVLVMHARDDEVIGFHHGERLFQAANQPKMWREMKGGHNAIEPVEIAQAVQAYLVANP